jgi:hypothetical protein
MQHGLGIKEKMDVVLHWKKVASGLSSKEKKTFLG